MIHYDYETYHPHPLQTVTRSSADADKPARRVYRLVKITKHGTIRYIRYGLNGFLVCYSNFVNKMRRFSDIRLQIMLWPLNPGQRSLKVIGTDTDRSATYDFLLKLVATISLTRTVSEINGNFSRKSQIFRSRVFNAPAEGIWNLVPMQRVEKLEWCGYQMVKKF